MLINISNAYLNSNFLVGLILLVIRRLDAKVLVRHCAAWLKPLATQIVEIPGVRTEVGKDVREVFASEATRSPVVVPGVIK